nr:aspartyl protease family protein 1 [Quercus suber]
MSFCCSCGQHLNPGSPANLPPNGILGLGINNLSVPSILASNGLVSNSFSMCFGADDLGRITFGDTGSSDQKIAPFTIEQPNFYNINISQITVESNVSQLDFSAIFDSGTRFTYLKDPAYTIISTSFDSQVKEYRSGNQSADFEYCYSSSLTLKGGDEYVVTNPVVLVNDRGIYCLAIGKIDGDSENNIIGQNFMTGYHIVFNGEKNVIGWKASDCGYSPSQSPPTPDGLSSQSCYGLETFGLDIHHRFSDTIKEILGTDGLPEKGSIKYYVAMARHDHIIRGHHLAANNNQSQPTFANGNETMFLPLYGYD